MIRKICSGLLIMISLMGLVWTAENAAGTKVAFAEPFIKLDYGQKMGKIPVWWMADKGSVRIAGTIAKPEFRIRATLCNEHYDMDERHYRFTQRNGEWIYWWDGWTGKHESISSHNWNTVKGNRLANDLLYIAIH